MGDLMKNKFQLVLMIVFGLAIVIAVVVFAKAGSKPQEGEILGAVTVWGTFEKNTFQSRLGAVAESHPDLKIDYQQFSEDRFQGELINALASGTGPDMIILSDRDVVEQRGRISVLPYENFPLDTYTNLYADAANVFLLPEGVAAFPFLVDPLVMYYNKDLLSSNFFVNPPTTWEGVIEMSPTITRKSDAGSISQSAFAMGTYTNVPHASDIVSLLSMQLGNFIVRHDGQKYDVVLNDPSPTTGGFAVLEGLQFYTSFARNEQPHYTWSASLQNARDAFVAGELAFYFGTSSEYGELVRRNPNLNFGATLVPQLSEEGSRLTTGRVYGLAVMQMSPNQGSAFAVANVLTDQSNMFNFSEGFAMPPIRRDLLSAPISDPAIATFYRSAIITQVWQRPHMSKVEEVFEDLIVGINSGRDTVNRLINIADDELQDLYLE